jgi:hypothetical protein
MRAALKRERRQERHVYQPFIGAPPGINLDFANSKGIFRPGWTYGGDHV